MADPKFTTIQVPARIADLGFSFSQPADFHAIELPAEQPDFTKPAYCFPLYVCMAGYGAVVFGVAARPAYEEGSVLQWGQWLLKEQGIQIESFKPTVISGIPAMLFETTQQTEAGTMRLRAAALEDGGRLVLLSAMAPEQVWPSLDTMFTAMLASFRLDSPKGPKAPLVPGEPVGPSAAQLEAQEKPARSVDLATADDPTSFNDEEPTNARLRDNGVGLVPRIHAVSHEEKSVTLAAAAIESTFRVPFGWHCIDDGKRTLIFDAAGKIQINLNLRLWDQDGNALLADILRQHLAEQPTIEHITLTLGGMPCLALRNYKVNDELLEQAFLVKPCHRPGMVLVARVTADPENMVRAMDLSEIVLRDLEPVGVAA